MKKCASDVVGTRNHFAIKPRAGCTCILRDRRASLSPVAIAIAITLTITTTIAITLTITTIITTTITIFITR